MDIKQTHSAHGIKLILEATQIIPDDPGQGTPAIVMHVINRKHFTSTYWCAMAEAELSGPNSDAYYLDKAQMLWLSEQDDLIDRFLKHFEKGVPR